MSLRFSVLYLISVFDTGSDSEELFVARVDAPPRHITRRTLTRLLGRSCTYYLTVKRLNVHLTFCNYFNIEGASLRSAVIHQPVSERSRFRFTWDWVNISKLLKGRSAYIVNNRRKPLHAYRANPALSPRHRSLKFHKTTDIPLKNTFPILHCNIKN